MKTETKKALIRMKELRDAATHGIYERVKLASGVLADLDWIAETHAGDQEKAADAVNGEYFPDLGGYLHIAKLVAIYKMFPAESQWKEYHYNLSAMEGLYDDQRERETKDTPERPRYKKVAEELEQKLEHVEFQARRNSELLEARERELREAQARIRQLEQEVALLRGKLEAYERISQRQAA